MESNKLKPRVCHILKENHARFAPKNVIFFDTETKTKSISPKRKLLSLKLGYAILTRRYPKTGYTVSKDIEFTTRNQYHKWITKVCVGKEMYYMVAHNVAFDVRITGIMKYLTTSGWERKSFILDKLNFMARYKKGATTIMIMNNQQLFNVSLRSLGESLGYSKLTVDFDTVDDTELMIYCRRDVDIMRVAWNLWYEYIKSNDLGNFKLTVGSQSFSAFRHRFMKEKIYIHTNDRAIELERRSYHGGRVECFFIGTYKDTKVYNLDINSMYPYIMSTQKLPTKLLKYYDQCPMDIFNHYRKTHAYIAEAVLEIPRPILPTTKEGRLVFPVGTIRGVFAKPELEYAASLGNLRSVYSVAFYSEEIVFKEFVDFFYKSRQQFKQSGNDQFAYISKILMNSLYGKFGQRITDFEKHGYNKNVSDHAGTTFDTTLGRIIKYRCIDGIIEYETGEHEANDSFVAIASSITASARVYLSKLIAIAGWNNVLYCDTDSLFVNFKGYTRLKSIINPTALGKLKIEGISDSVSIFGNKRYRFGDKVRNKGIRSDARLVGVNTYEQEQFHGFLSGLGNLAPHSVVIDTVRKCLSSEYTKGIVTSSGRVRPFVVNLE